MLGLDQVREVFAAGDGFDESGFNSFADADEVQLGIEGDLSGDEAGAEFGQAFTLLEHDLHPMAYGAVFFLPHEWTQMKDHE